VQGCAFLNYKKKEYGERAIKEHDGLMLHGKKLTVNWAFVE